MAKLPEVARLYQTYSQRGLMVIGVHDASSAPREVAQALRERNIPYPVMRDTDARDTFLRYRIVGIPHLILVGQDGTILADGKSLKEMERLIQQELGTP